MRSKSNKFSSIVLAVVTALGLVACEPSYYKALDGSSASDASSSDSSAADNVSNLPCVDNDKDKFCDKVSTQLDCNDNDSAINPGAAELCDGKDNNCNGVADEGCVAVVSPTCVGVDNDKDGFCATTASKPDCDDNDPASNPGAAEVCGNGKDDNCNGTADEGCAAATNSGNVLTVTYPSALTRVLNVQVTNNKADLGSYWNSGSPTSTGTSVTKDLGSITAAQCLYVRWSVSEGNPAYHWSCNGNGSTAALDSSASPVLKFLGQTYSSTNLVTWSASGGTNSGCSGLYVVPASGATIASCGF